MAAASTPPSGGNPPEPSVNVDLHPTEAPGFAAIVWLAGEHDLSTSDAIRDALSPIFGNVLLDLSECTFIDSSVISVIVGDVRARAREG